jgi:hypothetical protein
MHVNLTDAVAQVVRGPEGRVVVIFWGHDAEAEAARWADDGYRIDAIDRCQLAQ